LLLQNFGGRCPSVKDHRIEFAMTQPPIDEGIKLTPHTPWVWHVSSAGKRVGTVTGDGVVGFTARDVNHDAIGQVYVSAEAAVQAWVSPRDGQPSLIYPRGAFTYAGY
jgi:hypothetical protein